MRWGAARVPRHEAKTLMLWVSGADSLFSARPTVAQLRRFKVAVSQRAGGYPLQHIVGTAPFRDLEVHVGPGVFIPRPETEMLVEYALETGQVGRAADLCTGSGAIALALARAGWTVEAVEMSSRAVAYARRNLAGSAVSLHHQDALNWQGGVFDMVVTNPPYVDERVQGDVLFDPELALYGGGALGMDFPQALVLKARELLTMGGILLMEHAENQAEPLRTFAVESAGFSTAETLPDLAGRDRFLKAGV